MRVSPVSSEDADAGGFTILPPGDYDFIIFAAEETISKASGNEMLKLQLHVFDKDGKKGVVFDYILGNENGAWKARHMMESIGMVAAYEKGEISPLAIQGRPGRCKLRVRAATDQYPAQNQVQDYLVPGINSAQTTMGMPGARSAGGGGVSWDAKTKGSDIDDEIPF